MGLMGFFVVLTFSLIAVMPFIALFSLPFDCINVGYVPNPLMSFMSQF